MGDIQPVRPERMTAATVVEMFEPQIAEAEASIDEGRLAEADAQAALDKADTRFHAAGVKRTQKFEELREAQMDNLVRRERLEERQKVALAALGATDSSPAETFVAQTVIEGDGEEAATKVLEKIRNLNEELSQEDARQRLIVIGSFPVVSAVEAPGYMYQNTVSFVDVRVGDSSPVGIWRAAGRHYVNILSDQVTTINLPDREETIPYSRRDVTYNRAVAVEPLELKFVSSAEEFEEIVHGRIKPRLNRHGSMTVGPAEEDTLKPAIISGEAVDEFTYWLAQNNALRVLVFAASFDRAGNMVAEMPEIPEGSLEALKLARGTFLERVQGYVDDVVNNSVQEHVEIERLRNDPLFSREVQEYLGITDAELADHIAAAIHPYVSIEPYEDFKNRDNIDFRVITSGSRGFSSPDAMCDFVEKKFGEAGFDMSSSATLIMFNAARTAKLRALWEKREPLSDKRSDRKLIGRIDAAMEALRTQVFRKA